MCARLSHQALYNAAKYKDPEVEHAEEAARLHTARLLLNAHQCVHCGATDPDLGRKLDCMQRELPPTTATSSEGEVEHSSTSRKGSASIYMPSVASPSNSQQPRRRASSAAAHSPDDEVEAPWAKAKFPAK